MLLFAGNVVSLDGTSGDSRVSIVLPRGSPLQAILNGIIHEWTAEIVDDVLVVEEQKAAHGSRPSICTAISRLAWPEHSMHSRTAVGIRTWPLQLRCSSMQRSVSLLVIYPLSISLAGCGEIIILDSRLPRPRCISVVVLWKSTRGMHL